MREILFRGKRVDNGEWVEGYLLRTKFYLDDSEHSLIFTDVVEFPRSEFGGANEVKPETIGQYTGLNDKNGKRIFEGDIVQVWWNENHDEEPQKYKAIIEFGNPNCEFDWGWQLLMLDYFPFNKSILLWVDMEESGAYCEVIGNIHDNKELLEVEG